MYMDIPLARVSKRRHSKGITTWFAPQPAQVTTMYKKIIAICARATSALLVMDPSVVSTILVAFKTVEMMRNMAIRDVKIIRCLRRLRRSVKIAPAMVDRRPIIPFMP